MDQSACLLIAVRKGVRARVSEVLAGYELTFVERADQVRARMQADSYALVVLGSHFDESTTFAVLIDVLQRRAECRVACVRGAPFRGLGDSTMKAFREACLALGADLVIDLLEFPDDLEGNAAVRERLLTLLHRPPGMGGASPASLPRP